jgi:3-isopropylmalate/(R)-2-methylmalate dehydratase small subunit
MIAGHTWRFGDHVNTDLIIPGRYLDNYDLQHLASHVMEDADPRFARSVRPGDIILAGRNFGCGSSREQAPLAIKGAGVAVVVVGSVARIFYRNAINVGLPVVICPEAVSILDEGDEAEIDLEGGMVRNKVTGEVARFRPLPPFLMDILRSGGLVPYMRQRLQDRTQ